MPTIVALVSEQPHPDLVRYLETVGFVGRTPKSPTVAPREGVLVWLLDHARDDKAVVDMVRGWLGAKALRAILVSDRPVRLQKVAEDHRGRVVLLPAPVFGWQLVDALREAAPTP